MIDVATRNARRQIGAVQLYINFMCPFGGNFKAHTADGDLYPGCEKILEVETSSHA